MMRFLFFLVLLGCLSVVPAEEVRGPFGIMKFPEDYTSKRVTIQKWIEENETITVAQISGEGCLKHIWGTFHEASNNTELGNDLILRIYVDGNENPHVEVPFAAFFSHFHSIKPGIMESPLMRVTDMGGFNCYFPMPFSDGMIITLENETDKSFDVYFQGDYHQYETGTLNEKRRFRAQFRRQNPGERYGRPYLAGFARGEGFIAGMAVGMTVSDMSDAWYHNGGDMVLLDGDTAKASIINGIGGEDYFGNAYGMDAYTNGPVGCPYYQLEKNAPTFLDFSEDMSKGDSKITQTPYLRFAAYRHYLADPIRFHSSFALYFGAYKNNISSVVYWYQSDFKEGDYQPLLEKSKRSPDSIVTIKDLPQPKKGLVWNICGPFSYENEEEFNKGEVPEEKIDFSWKQPADFGLYQFAREKMWGYVDSQWIRNVSSVYHFINFRPYFHTKGPTNFAYPTNVSAYAYTIINSEKDETRKLRLGYDDPVRVWINGKRIFDGKAGAGFRSEEIEIDLKAGENKVLLKSGNADNQNMRAWVVQFQLLN